MAGRILMLSKKKDFDQIFKNGRSCYDKTFGLKALGNELKQFRLGMIISTKISKKAVQRNLLKRRLKEIIKQALIDEAGGQDLVLVALPGACEKNFMEIKNSVQLLLRKLQIIGKAK